MASNLLKKIMGRVYLAPEDDTGSSNGGGTDRGDDFVATGTDTGATDKAAATDTVITDEDKEKVGLKAGAPADAAKDGEDDDKDDKDGKKKGGIIPRDRHEAILNREREQRRALEAQLAQVQKGQQQTQVNEVLKKYDDKIADLETKQVKAMTDGDTEKALQLGRELRAVERERGETVAEQRNAVSTAQAVETTRYGMAVERIEEAFPVMNPDSDDFDEDVVRDVLAMKAGYEGTGLSPTDALQKAVKRLLKPETRKQENATEVTPRVSADDVAKERKKDAVEKAVDTSKKQPPATTKVGENSDKLGGQLTAEKVIGMSQKDFAKLDEKELARLRGDDV
jgi:hypothetical protein